MIKKKELQKMKLKKDQEFVTINQGSQRNSPLIFTGVILAITSIGLLIFVLREKIFYLN